jgi:predicted site-specific integrase-resolvase
MLEGPLSPLSPLVEDFITMASHSAGKIYGMSRKYRRVVEGARRLIEDP